jgi:hypothetical protein
MPPLLATVLLGVALLSAQAVWAQEKQQGQEASLAKQSQNPVANMISVPFENNYMWRAGPDNDTTINVLNVKPVLPTKISKNWNLINRAILPLIYQESLSGEVVIPTDSGHYIAQVSEGSKTAFGDLLYQGFFSPANPGKFIWGVGPAINIPLGADRFSSNKWSAGPAVVGLTMPGHWVIGALIQNIWSFAGDSDADNVNAFTAQYFVNYNMKKGWYLTSTPVITANWKEDSDNTWTVPFGGGAGRIFKIGSQHLNAKLQGFYTPSGLRPDGASDWNVQFSLVFLFPKHKK